LVLWLARLMRDRLDRVAASIKFYQTILSHNVFAQLHIRRAVFLMHAETAAAVAQLHMGIQFSEGAGGSHASYFICSANMASRC